MRMVGLIGGMSWESTAVYYRRMNEEVQRRLGGMHSADILLRSVDFAPIVEMQTRGAWDEAAIALGDAALGLSAAGAQCVVLCTNTMHKVADDVEARSGIPLLHIADITAAAIRSAGCKRPLLLATRYTMEQDFYVGRLRDRHGLAALVPDAGDRTVVHDIIYNELCLGQIRPDSKQAYLAIVAKGLEAGADSVIFGCTEVGLLLKAQDLACLCFDSTLLHADAAVDFALAAEAVAT